MMRRFRVPVLHPCSIAGKAATDSKVVQGCCNDRGRPISARWLRDVADFSLFRAQVPTTRPAAPHAIIIRLPKAGTSP